MAKGFFDTFHAFYRTSSVGSSPNRLNGRYRVLIEEHLPVIRGKAVLDLACHDGRWSFAAYKAGARHVIGIEARERLVHAARANLREYCLLEDQVTIVQGDIYDVLSAFEPGEIDTVLCLGFFYHTLHHMRLLHLLARLCACHVLIDTAITKSAVAAIRLRHEKAENEANAFAPGREDALVGVPSKAALEQMLRYAGFGFSFYDWHNGKQESWEGLEDYRERRRVSLLATNLAKAGK